MIIRINNLIINKNKICSICEEIIVEMIIPYGIKKIYTDCTPMMNSKQLSEKESYHI